MLGVVCISPPLHTHPSKAIVRSIFLITTNPPPLSKKYACRNVPPARTQQLALRASASLERIIRALSPTATVRQDSTATSLSHRTA